MIKLRNPFYTPVPPAPPEPIRRGGQPFAIVFECPHCTKELFWGGHPKELQARYDKSNVPLAEAIELLTKQGRYLACGKCNGSIRLDVSAQVKVVAMDRPPSRTTVVD